MKQIVSRIINEEEGVKHECKGRRLAISRSVYRLANTYVFYVQSSTVPSRYYYYLRFQYEPTTTTILQKDSINNSSS